MCNLKKTVLAVLALGGSTLFAGTMGPAVCTIENVTIPCNQSSWDFGVQALYLQPTYASDPFLTSFVNASGIAHFNNLNPSWGWGYKLEGSYHFSQGTDINVNWSHYSKTTNNALLIGAAEAPATVLTSLKPQWDAVNVELGQRVDLGARKNVRLHGGAQFGRVSNNYFANFPNVNLPTDEIRSKYNGFGPRIGADLSYYWDNGLAIYANGATALLIGTSQFSTVTSGIFDVVGGSNGSKKTVVPELEGKLGVKYTHGFSQGNLTLDVGYMWLNYFHVQDFLTVSGLGGTTDFGLNGPYIGLKWAGYV